MYLNGTIAVAAANARRAYEGEIATLYDLRPEQRPSLQIVNVTESPFVDAVTDEGLLFLGLPPSYPMGVEWKQCQEIGRRLYDEDENGIACPSNAAPGEELAIFDTALALVARGARLPFSTWYPV